MNSSSVFLQSCLCYVRASVFKTRLKYLWEIKWKLSKLICKVKLILAEFISGPTIVWKKNSIWAKSFEGNVSWNSSLLNSSTFFESQIKLNWSSLKCQARDSVLIISHSFRAAFWLKLCHTEINTLHI